MHRLDARTHDIFEDPRLVLIIQELGRRKIRAPEDTAGPILQHDVDHAIRSGIRKRIEDDVAKHAVDDGDGPDTDGKREDRDDREPGASGERPERVADITSDIVHPHDRPRLTLEILHRFYSSEGAE